jgi:hypothetical protein
LSVLSNLQLLTDSENLSKNATPFEEWIQTRDTTFRKRHLIPELPLYHSGGGAKRRRSYCVAKGKEHKQYEFGAKASLVVGETHEAILGALSLEKNTYDGHTVDAALTQVEKLAGYRREFAMLPAERGLPV